MNKEAVGHAGGGKIKAREFVADVPDPFERGEVEGRGERREFEVIDGERDAQREAKSFPSLCGGNGSGDGVIGFGRAVDTGTGGVFKIEKSGVVGLPLGAIGESDRDLLAI